LEAGRLRSPGRLLQIAAWSWTVGLHILLWVMEIRGRPLWGDEQRYMESARALLSGSPAWWPDPLWPPLPAHFLAGILSIGGPGVITIGVVQEFLLLVTALALADLIGRWSDSVRAGRIALWLCLSYPPLVAFTHYLWPEILHLSLFVMTLWILSVRWESLRWCLAAGLCLGLALLTKSLLGPFIPFLLAGAFWRRGWLRPALVTLSLMLTISPVLAAQYQRLGKPMIADSSAFNLWVGINDRGLKNFRDEYVARAYEDFRCTDGNFFERSASLRSRAFDEIRRRGILTTLRGQLCRQYFRLLDRESYLGEQLGQGAAVRQGLGYRAAGRGLLLRGSSFLIYGVLLALLPASLLLYSWRDLRWVRIMLLFLVYNLALFFWLHVKSRYRIQLLPVLFMAAPMISGLLTGFEGRLRPLSRLRLLLSAAIGTLALFLAFAGPYLE